MECDGSPLGVAEGQQTSENSGNNNSGANFHVNDLPAERHALTATYRTAAASADQQN